MEECGECLKTVTEKFQIPEAEDSSPPQLKRHELRKAMTKSCIKILAASGSAIESAFPDLSGLSFKARTSCPSSK